MSKGTNVASNNTGKKQQGAKNAPAKSQNANGATEKSGEEKNDSDSTDGDGKPGTEVVVTANSNGTENAPAPVADAPKTTITKKMPPLKNARRGGGGRTAHSGKPQYNVAIVSYNDIVVDKDGELKFVPHIANGNWVPTYNGDTQEGCEIDTTKPVFTSMEAAIAAGAVEFGMKVLPKDMKKLYGFAQNIQLKEGGFPLTGKVHATNGKKWKAGDPVAYSCFLTATEENYEQVVKNIKTYLEHPSTVGNRDIIELLPAPYKLTYPQSVAPEIGGAKVSTEVATA